MIALSRCRETSESTVVSTEKSCSFHARMRFRSNILWETCLFAALESDKKAGGSLSLSPVLVQYWSEVCLTQV